ncbi:hypothetical protein AAE485_01180 [Acidithiobacillus ferriphilus]|uniref:hypothetical protein n=1 Tax=Acidithiobacillus ferriphilus TaxID=1689834 RepID=UPI002DBE1BFD|nr:hypothetical protein [Acidithiobacillus ferriphilus]MEB8534732.1 hypothetical protein [Acidithiobacillus ferriphilus]
MREKRKTHGAMTLDDIIKIDEKIGLLCERGAPALVPERYAHLVIATKMARRMAYHPEIADFGYIQELLQSTLPKTTAGRIVKKARELAKLIQPVQESQTLPAHSVPGGTDRPSTEMPDRKPKQELGIQPQKQEEERLKGDPRESDGFVWDPKAGGQGDYVDPQTLISGFIRVRDGDVWDARHGKFLKRSTLQDGYKREEDDWIWNSTMGMYRDPNPKAANPYGLPDG